MQVQVLGDKRTHSSRLRAHSMLLQPTPFAWHRCATTSSSPAPLVVMVRRVRVREGLVSCAAYGTQRAHELNVILGCCLCSWVGWV